MPVKVVNRLKARVEAIRAKTAALFLATEATAGDRFNVPRRLCLEAQEPVGYSLVKISSLS